MRMWGLEEEDAAPGLWASATSLSLLLGMLLGVGASWMWMLRQVVQLRSVERRAATAALDTSRLLASTAAATAAHRSTLELLLQQRKNQELLRYMGAQGGEPVFE